MKDGIGDRIKRYEAVTHHMLTRRVPVFIRVDGRAFHTFTKNMVKPFDTKLIEAMVVAGEKTAKEISGFKIGYHQSDEFTFMLLDTDTLETEAYFDYDLSKLVSVVAATFTAYFNKEMGGTTQVFDARAFNVPIEDAANVFIWRQRDWERNSLQMFSRTFFSQKQLHGKNREAMHEMLYSKGENWAMLVPPLKNGTFIISTGERISEKMTYEKLNKLITL